MFLSEVAEWKPDSFTNIKKQKQRDGTDPDSLDGPEARLDSAEASMRAV